MCGFLELAVRVRGSGERLVVESVFCYCVKRVLQWIPKGNKCAYAFLKIESPNIVFAVISGVSLEA